MTALIVTFGPWLLSVTTIYVMFLAGETHRNTWLIGVGNQVLWLIWIVAAGAWGLIPGTVAMAGVYIMNHIKWRGAQ